MPPARYPRIHTPHTIVFGHKAMVGALVLNNPRFARIPGASVVLRVSQDQPTGLPGAVSAAP
ncbi:hypothetical protein GCM10027088_40290 [Nocardia goodfellowii]